MKEYLILLYSDDVSAITGEENFENYKTWAAYLTRFSTDKDFVSGSQTNKTMKILDSQEMIREHQQSSVLCAYMILRAKNFEEVSCQLHEIPFLTKKNAEIQIHELNPLASI